MGCSGSSGVKNIEDGENGEKLMKKKEKENSVKSEPVEVERKIERKKLPENIVRLTGDDYSNVPKENELFESIEENKEEDRTIVQVKSNKSTFNDDDLNDSVNSEVHVPFGSSASEITEVKTSETGSSELITDEIEEEDDLLFHYNTTPNITRCFEED